MKPGKLITVLMRQKKTGIFIFNTAVLVIASFVAGYNMRMSAPPLQHPGRQTHQ